MLLLSNCLSGEGNEEWWEKHRFFAAGTPRIDPHLQQMLGAWTFTASVTLLRLVLFCRKRTSMSNHLDDPALQRLGRKGTCLQVCSLPRGTNPHGRELTAGWEGALSWASLVISDLGLGPGFTLQIILTIGPQRFCSHALFVDEEMETQERLNHLNLLT